MFTLKKKVQQEEFKLFHLKSILTGFSLLLFHMEAIQIIPTLGYYDANRVKIVGSGPSWSTRTMIKEQKNIERCILSVKIQKI